MSAPQWDPVWGPREPPRRRRVRRLLKRLASRLLARGRPPADPGRGYAILAYHGTGAAKGDPWWLDFHGQMQLLEDLGYRVASLDSVVQRLAEGGGPEVPTVAITFDDGYANNLRVAFPELARRGWPATLFLTTSWVGRRPFLLPTEVARLRELGVEVGNHTHTHPDLRPLGRTEIAAELDRCSARVEEWSGARPRHFCYPYGRFDPEVRAAVASTGLESACTGRVGFNSPGQDPFALRRVTIERGDGAGELRRRLAGGYDFTRWRRLRTP